MDLGIISALVMLIVWGVVTFRGDAPGFIHILLSVGMFLLIYRIVIRGTHRSGTAGGRGRGGTTRAGK